MAKILCPACEGNGVVPPSTCWMCDGAGIIPSSLWKVAGAKCPLCHGFGTIGPARRCAACHGNGKVKAKANDLRLSVVR